MVRLLGGGDLEVGWDSRFVPKSRGSEGAKRGNYGVFAEKQIFPDFVLDIGSKNR